MKRATALVAILIAAAASTACEEKASDGEIQEMCRRALKLGGEYDLTPAELRVDKAEKEIENRLKHLEGQREDELRKIDAANMEKFLTLKTEEERTAHKAEVEAAKAAKAAEFKAQIDALSTTKAESLAGMEKKAKDEIAAADAAVGKCAAQAKSAGISKKVAQCRISAMTSEDYEKCR